MNIVSLIFGERRRVAPLFIAEAPVNVVWRSVRARADSTPLRAWRAEADHDVKTGHGVLHARAGIDYIIAYERDEHAVVAPDVFEQTYEPLGGGLYRKRTDVKLRYFTLDQPVIVRTLEGEQRAAAGDWIMQGVAGELWPVPHDKALEKYDPA